MPRLLILVLAAVVASGGAFGHTDGWGPMSFGTVLFPPDHAPHPPFVPEKEHPCAACAIAHLTAPPPAPAWLRLPGVRPAEVVSAERPLSTLAEPDITGRSPPFPPAA